MPHTASFSQCRRHNSNTLIHSYSFPLFACTHISYPLFLTRYLCAQAVKPTAELNREKLKKDQESQSYYLKMVRKVRTPAGKGRSPSPQRNESRTGLSTIIGSQPSVAEPEPEQAEEPAAQQEGEQAAAEEPAAAAEPEQAEEPAPEPAPPAAEETAPEPIAA